MIQHHDIAESLEEPWFAVFGQTAAVHTTELRKELAADHPLYSRRGQLVVIAKCGANDDVLVVDTLDPQQLYCVHLTWARHPEATGWPRAHALKRSELNAFFATYAGL